MSKCSTARTYQFRVRLTRDGCRWLDDRLAAHCRRYNAALQERQDAWRMARRSISFAYGEGYVSIYRVIRPAISVTSTASAGSRATFVVYDCNATNVDRSPGNGGAGLIEIDLHRWPTATLLAVSGPKGISVPLGDFQGLSVSLTHGDPGDFTLKLPLSTVSASSGGPETLVVCDCNSANLAGPDGGTPSTTREHPA